MRWPMPGTLRGARAAGAQCANGVTTQMNECVMVWCGQCRPLTQGHIDAAVLPASVSTMSNYHHHALHVVCLLVSQTLPTTLGPQPPTTQSLTQLIRTHSPNDPLTGCPCASCPPQSRQPLAPAVQIQQGKTSSHILKPVRKLSVLLSYQSKQLAVTCRGATRAQAPPSVQEGVNNTAMMCRWQPASDADT